MLCKSSSQGIFQATRFTFLSLTSFQITDSRTKCIRVYRYYNKNEDFINLRLTNLLIIYKQYNYLIC